jgi:nucleoside-diphosphate-sugar epimerase
VVNVASGSPVTVRQLLHMIASELGSVPRIVESGGPRGRSDVFDNSLARRLFGSYERPIAEGLRAYVGYFRDGRRHACV